jgi:hypothetical protein
MAEAYRRIVLAVDFIALKNAGHDFERRRWSRFPFRGHDPLADD